ncbi:MAG: aminopeptidase [Candidatus Shapirobacteria bacterium]|nr:aminopeptidase [Candidatus Shapirobacteria bacterium]
MSSYQPNKQILERYAQVLINFALNQGQGIKKDEVVFLQVPECAKSMLVALRKTILQSGAHAIIQYLPDNLGREFYQLASKKQLEFFPEKYLKGIIGQADHFVSLIADTDKHELEGIDPNKIMTRTKAFTPYKKWREEKENRGQLTWTLGLYGTVAMAKEVGLTIEEYWQQIIKACFLHYDQPIKKWQWVGQEIDRIKNKLNQLNIASIQIIAQDTDLIVGLGTKRQWLGGSGNNIPSFEIFTSPDYRQTEGKITFNQPLYIFGHLVEGVYLEFKKGKIVNVKAKKNQELLQKMIQVPGANQIGEFSLTDGRLSKITKFMGETLYDENRGGKWGNCHLALGSAYKDCFRGKKNTLSDRDWLSLGFNDSVIHTDIVSTANRIITARLTNGNKKIIYKNGQFTI